MVEFQRKGKQQYHNYITQPFISTMEHVKLIGHIILQTYSKYTKYSLQSLKIDGNSASLPCYLPSQHALSIAE